ncbi:methyltransferase [Vibrio hepatarius]|uniref:methyltransferase n=1 Tax=Vibrio hepatarius TaxID=171383 RepID=UPI00142DEC0D|nr:methyltransferase [Vibrio hepatarius]NIY82142.1 methyltransferase [Vibrio hepatarius]
MQQQFQKLDSVLSRYQSFWRFEPFFQSLSLDLPWVEQFPQLCEWLSSLSNQQIEFYKQHNEELEHELARVLPEMLILSELTSLQRLALNGIKLPRGVDAGIPGRKLEQIISMSEASITHHAGSEWLEWCSGKGFLGRILASQSLQSVTSFEFQAALCQSGQKEADKQGLPMHFVQGDALSNDAASVMNSNQHAVALHACGDLHVSLIRHGCQKGLPAMTISPCCYHLIQNDSYQPLSTVAKASALTLSKNELRIPLQETVTGGERVKRHRYQEMSYRLGFDLLLRSECGFQHYEPVPSIKKSLLAEGFDAFCQWAAQQKGITLPKLDAEHYLRLGKARYWQMERVSLVQQIFRRALELWLVLDKAIYLEEQGYKVEVNEFCSKQITPRNILIQAVKV